MRRPQTARLGLRQINARRSPGDNGLHSLSLPPAIVLDLPLPLTLTLHLNSPLALELSRRFPLEPLASKPSPRFFRPTRPSAGSRSQQSERRMMLQRRTKQPRVGSHPVHRTPAGTLAALL